MRADYRVNIYMYVYGNAIFPHTCACKLCIRYSWRLGVGYEGLLYKYRFENLMRKVMLIAMNI